MRNCTGRPRFWALVCAGSGLAAAAGAVGPSLPPFALGDFGRGAAIAVTSGKLEARESDGVRRVAFREDVLVRQGGLELRADAVEAEYREGERQPRRLRASGDVRIREGERQARCRSALYDHAARRIECRGAPAELRDGEDRLFGGHIAFDLDARRVRVEEDPRVEIHRAWRFAPSEPGAEPESDSGASAAPPERDALARRLGEGGPVHLRAERLEARDVDGEGRILLEDSVVVEQGGLELRSEELEIVYPEGAEQPEHVRARRDVRVLEGRREARCDVAEYRPAEARVACEGEAQLREGEDRVDGDRITFHLEARRIDVDGHARLRVDPARRDADAGAAR